MIGDGCNILSFDYGLEFDEHILESEGFLLCRGIVLLGGFEELGPVGNDPFDVNFCFLEIAMPGLRFGSLFILVSYYSQLGWRFARLMKLLKPGIKLSSFQILNLNSLYLS